MRSASYARSTLPSNRAAFARLLASGSAHLSGQGFGRQSVSSVAPVARSSRPSVPSRLSVPSSLPPSLASSASRPSSVGASTRRPSVREYLERRKSEREGLRASSPPESGGGNPENAKSRSMSPPHSSSLGGANRTSSDIKMASLPEFRPGGAMYAPGLYDERPILILAAPTDLQSRVTVVFQDDPRGAPFKIPLQDISRTLPDMAAFRLEVARQVRLAQLLADEAASERKIERDAVVKMRQAIMAAPPPTQAAMVRHMALLGLDPLYSDAPLTVSPADLAVFRAAHPSRPTPNSAESNRLGVESRRDSVRILSASEQKRTQKPGALVYMRGSPLDPYRVLWKNRTTVSARHVLPAWKSQEWNLETRVLLPWPPPRALVEAFVAAATLSFVVDRGDYVYNSARPQELYRVSDKWSGKGRIKAVRITDGSVWRMGSDAQRVGSSPRVDLALLSADDINRLHPFVAEMKPSVKRRLSEKQEKKKKKSNGGAGTSGGGGGGDTVPALLEFKGMGWDDDELEQRVLSDFGVDDEDEMDRAQLISAMNERRLRAHKEHAENKPLDADTLEYIALLDRMGMKHDARGYVQV